MWMWYNANRDRRLNLKQRLMLGSMKSKKFRSPIIVIAVISLVAGAAFVVPPARAGQVKEFTAEQLAETVIVANGSRPLLSQIRGNGVERGRQTRTARDAQTTDAPYEVRFVRAAKDAH